jgi:hypothetical protein
LFSLEQKQLILDVLQREKRKLFSRNKGALLNKTIDDLAQMIRNESLNSPKSSDKTLDWSTRRNNKAPRK